MGTEANPFSLQVLLQTRNQTLNHSEKQNQTQVCKTTTENYLVKLTTSQ